MTVHRAYFRLPTLEHAKSGDTIELPDDVVHRLTRVLRLGPSQRVELFDEGGNVAIGHLASATGSLFRIDEVRRDKKESRRLTLIQAHVKQDKLEEIVQRNTELGVDRFVIFTAERSLVKITDRTPTQMERLTRIATDASRQCERNDIPKIEGPFSFSHLKSVFGLKNTLFLLGSPREGGSLHEMIESLDMSKFDEVALIVGPEGGLSELEEETLVSYGAIQVRYARHILRTETAGIVGVSIIQGFL